MRRFDVLDSTQNILGPHFLEASAGTGKTFAIEHIVVRLLLESATLLQEILVVTFTRAATRELKQRIRLSIKNALEYLEKNHGKHPYLQEILASKEKKNEAIKKLQGALSVLDQIQVYTIHGFCHQMLTTYAFDAGIGLHKIDKDRGSYQDVERAEVLDFLRTDLKQQGFHRHQIHKILRKMQGDMHRLVQRILTLIRQEAEFPQLLSYQKLLEKFKASFKKVDKSSANLLEQFLFLAPLFNKLCSKNKAPHPHFLQQAERIKQCVDDPESAEQVFEDLLREDEWLFKYLAENFLKKNAPQSFEALYQKNPLMLLAKELQPILEEAMDSAKILLRLAACCKPRVQEALMSRKMTPPDDLLKLMYASVLRTGFCQKVQGRYQAAIIDEFQDTDPVQWKIFHHLFMQERPGFPLYLVGDPKQSIYGFRNADLPTYLSASQKFSLEQRYALSVNYRSEPKLMEGLNRLFSLAPDWLSEEESLTYHQVDASPQGKNTEFQDKLSPVHFFVAEQAATKEKRQPSKQAEETYFFPFIAQEIFKLHAQGKKFRAFAILIRDRFQGERLERYLKKLKIPCVATSVVNLVDTMAFSFLKTLCHMLEHVEDLSAIKLVLAHPFMGFTHEELRVDRKNAKTFKAILQLKELSLLYFEKGFFCFWERLLWTSFHDEEEFFEERLVKKNLQHYQDLAELIEILQKEDPYGSLSQAEFIHRLERLAEEDPETHEYLKRKISSEEDAVTIMTMHKSKGLEFDIVFALGVVMRTGTQEEIIKCDQEWVLLEDPDSRRAFQKLQEEKLRQLYVALTRAKTRVYIPLCFSEEGSPKENSGLAPIEIFLQKAFKGKSIDSYSKASVIEALHALSSHSISLTDLNENLPHIVPSSEVKTIEIPLPRVYRKKFVDVYSSSYSKLAQEAGQEAGSVSEWVAVKELPTLPASADTGHRLHKILEKIFERGSYLETSSIEQLVAQELLLSPLAEFQEEVTRLIKRALTVQLITENQRVSFQEISPSQIMTEMEFLFVEKQLLKGFIDLCFQYQGKYYLVDWKSNFLGSQPHHYSKQALEKCMQENHYFLQAHLYGKALRAYLQALGKDQTCYGGIFYVFLRGLEEEGTRGVYHVL